MDGEVGNIPDWFLMWKILIEKSSLGSLQVKGTISEASKIDIDKLN
jgi:hypothetical protein